MANSTLTMNATKTGLLTGGQDNVGVPPLYNSNAPDSITQQAFTAATFAAVTPPPGTVNGCICVPPTSNAGAITVKGATGDTGLVIPAAFLNTPFLIPSAAFGILCVAGITLEFWWF